jgi:arabinose-5-phosphate isomerase
MNLVPTASTTAALALGDALAMTLVRRKRAAGIVLWHPGGELGKQ